MKTGDTFAYWWVSVVAAIVLIAWTTRDPVEEMKACDFEWEKARHVIELLEGRVVSTKPTETTVDWKGKHRNFYFFCMRARGLAGWRRCIPSNASQDSQNKTGQKLTCPSVTIKSAGGTDARQSIECCLEVSQNAQVHLWGDHDSTGSFYTPVGSADLGGVCLWQSVFHCL